MEIVNSGLRPPYFDFEFNIVKIALKVQQKRTAPNL